LPPDLAEMFAAAYAGPDGDLSDGGISPARADLAGLPPFHIEVGGAEVLLGQVSSFAAAALMAGVDVNLHVGPDMVHVFQLLAPGAVCGGGGCMSQCRVLAKTRCH